MPKIESWLHLPDFIYLFLGLKDSLARGSRPKTPLSFKIGSSFQSGGRPIEFGLEQQAVEGFLEKLKTSGLGLGLAEGFLERLKTSGLGLVMGTT
jgi:hypothetical protein